MGKGAIPGLTGRQRKEQWPEAKKRKALTKSQLVRVSGSSLPSHRPCRDSGPGQGRPRGEDAWLRPGGHTRLMAGGTKSFILHPALHETLPFPPPTAGGSTREASAAQLPFPAGRTLTPAVMNWLRHQM